MRRGHHEVKLIAVYPDPVDIERVTVTYIEPGEEQYGYETVDMERSSTQPGRFTLVIPPGLRMVPYRIKVSRATA